MHRGVYKTNYPFYTFSVLKQSCFSLAPGLEIKTLMDFQKDSSMSSFHTVNKNNISLFNASNAGLGLSLIGAL